MAKKYLLEMMLVLCACVLVYIWIIVSGVTDKKYSFIDHRTSRRNGSPWLKYNLKNKAVNSSKRSSDFVSISYLTPTTTTTSKSALKLSTTPTLISSVKKLIQTTTATTERVMTFTISTSPPSITTTDLTTTADPLVRPDNCSFCFIHNFTYIHVNKDICNEKESSNIDIVILISTTPANQYKRKVIRKTWLEISKNNTSNVRYVFLLGSQSNLTITKYIASEFDQYSDIVQEDFIDSYNNLTLKTLMGFKWANLYCSSAKFVMKTDDDMYVNVTNLMKIARGHEEQLNTSIGGACKYVAFPIRDSRSKWYASFRQYPRSEYPGYCSGTGYVTSMAVMQKVLAVSKDIPFFYLEDVYVSLCIKHLGYSLTNLDGFNAAQVPLDICVYKGSKMVTSHGVTPEDMFSMFIHDCIVTENTTRTSKI